MPNYQQAKIYEICSPHTDKIYIGATIEKYLSNRFNKHKYKNHTRSQQIIDMGDSYINLLESYPCNCKEELNAREREWIEANGERVVNKQFPGRTRKEYNLVQKECECGSTFNQGRECDHVKTKKHKTYVSSLVSDDIKF